MSAFTDEDLERFKHEMNLEPPVVYGPDDLEKLNALLARLEAAECVCITNIVLVQWMRTCRRMVVELGERFGYTAGDSTREKLKIVIQKADEALNEWCKAAGK